MVKRIRTAVAEMLGNDKDDDGTFLAGMVIIGAIKFKTMDPDILARHFKEHRYKVRDIVKRLRKYRIWEGNLMDIGMWMEGDDPTIKVVSFALQALAAAGHITPKKNGDLFTIETTWMVV